MIDRLMVVLITTIVTLVTWRIGERLLFIGEIYIDSSLVRTALSVFIGLVVVAVLIVYVLLLVRIYQDIADHWRTR